jgi:hypothetical protein
VKLSKDHKHQHLDTFQMFVIDTVESEIEYHRATFSILRFKGYQ